jgi:hypothetical protein
MSREHDAQQRRAGTRRRKDKESAAILARGNSGARRERRNERTELSERRGVEKLKGGLDRDIRERATETCESFGIASGKESGEGRDGGSIEEGDDVDILAQHLLQLIDKNRGPD